MTNEQAKQITLFEKTINRLELIATRNSQLAERARTKSVRISNSISPSPETPKADRDQSIIGLLNALMDNLDESQEILKLVVEDLETAIP